MAVGLILSLLLTFGLAPDASIQGVVRQAGSLEPIAHATVQIPELSRSVITDAHGFFVFVGIPEGKWRIDASALGYDPHSITAILSAGRAVRLEFELQASPFALRPVEVTADPADGQYSTGVGSRSARGPAPIRVDASVVEQLPALGERDVLRAVQLLPSVQSSSDFSSALYIRGGLPDQNLVRLNGVPLFNPFHLAGLFSAFDPEATESIEIVPGAFPARVGDRLSSAIDVRTREGGRDRVRGGGALGLISSRMLVDGPLPGGGGSFLLSGRRSYLDLATRAAAAARPGTRIFPYSFDDAHLKLTHDVGDLGKLSISGYYNSESLRSLDSSAATPERGSGDRADFAWGSSMLSAQYRQPIGSSLLAEMRGGISEFGGHAGVWDGEPIPSTAGPNSGSAPLLSAQTLERNLFAGVDLSWIGVNQVHRIGFQLDQYLFDHAVATGAEGRTALGGVVPALDLRELPATAAIYAEEEWSPTEMVSVRGGVRTLYAGPLGHAWLPRLGARLAIAPGLSLTIGASYSAQAVRSIRNQESIWSSIVAYDLLSAVPREFGLSRARDLTIGAQWTTARTGVRVDAYARAMSNVAFAPIPEDIWRAPVLAPEVESPGSAMVRGLEISGEHTYRRAHLSLSYAWTSAHFEVGGERFIPRFERRHTLDVFATIPWNEAGMFSTRLALASGQPTTPVDGATQLWLYDPALGGFTGEQGNGLPLIGTHNSKRLSAYLRLDMAVRRNFERKWFGRPVRFTPYLSILNVLNTPNTLVETPEIIREAWKKYTPQMPIFPTFGIEWTF